MSTFGFAFDLTGVIFFCSGIFFLVTDCLARQMYHEKLLTLHDSFVTVSLVVLTVRFLFLRYLLVYMVLFCCCNLICFIVPLCFYCTSLFLYLFVCFVPFLFALSSFCWYNIVFYLFCSRAFCIFLIWFILYFFFVPLFCCYIFVHIVPFRAHCTFFVLTAPPFFVFTYCKPFCCLVLLGVQIQSQLMKADAQLKPMLKGVPNTTAECHSSLMRIVSDYCRLLRQVQQLSDDGHAIIPSCV